MTSTFSTFAISVIRLTSTIQRHRRITVLLSLWTLAAFVLWPTSLLAQATEVINRPPAPQFWYLLTAALSFLVPAGLILLAAAYQEPAAAWNTALGGLAAVGLAAAAYWAVGFALQFGGVGLVYPQTELRALVWEWSPLSTDWGIGWGMAGLSGWFLSGPDVTALAYTLFLAHLPWVMTAAALPIMALRGRAPTTVTIILAVLLGGFVMPLAGNWVQGGGWLGALGRNMNLGHGFVDFGGAGVVHLVAAAFGLAGLGVWSTRRNRTGQTELPATPQPLLSVVGALLTLGGALGWLWANPLQTDGVGDLGMMRGSVNLMLAASGGSLLPLIYTWFVTGRSDPTMTARGLAAGVVSGLAIGPFAQPGVAMLIGVMAGASVPFSTFVLDGRLRLNDATGLVISSGIPAAIGLVLVGLFADGVVGNGWQMTGMGAYRGVAGQGVSGLLVARGFQLDFPGQLQAQLIGLAALGVWGFVTGLLICIPLGLIFHGLQQGQTTAPVAPVTQRAAPPATPTPFSSFDSSFRPAAPPPEDSTRF